MDIVKLAINNARLTISALLFLLVAGWVAYESTPKEAEPDVPIPMMYVSLIYQGISPEDSERLLLRPMESKLKSLKGLKEMRSAACGKSALASCTLLRVSCSAVARLVCGWNSTST